MANKKRLVIYHHFRDNFDLRPEIENALELIAKDEDVFDIEIIDDIAGHSKEPHLDIKGYVGNAINAWLHTADKYGKKAGCKMIVYSKATGEGLYKLGIKLKSLFPKSEPKPQLGYS
ncbi:hypothetical protein J4423_01015 [Candidatus Pacearchaeota archaeon]|nr:hypothetical protein [Candidatus Pacearchaeota archaeon]